ncbi:ACT domain-containing family protein [Striga asiatica]|uniref:ACT domain-containing protein ACR n=1 Tax=Striga asiatica TaxID=4170 RepID=A0A5A7P1G1_STRAF|nr:ACT domain-containing family protein [Striga asiatica]
MPRDNHSGSPIEDEKKLDTIGAILENVLKKDNNIRSLRTSVLLAVMHTERRLHQFMFADQDCEMRDVVRSGLGSSVSVGNYLERRVSVRPDWNKLMQERRASKGARIELCADDRKGLLADMMRTFHENGLRYRQLGI